MEIKKHGKKISITFDTPADRKLLREFIENLRKEGRSKECQQLESALEGFPPEIDPGG